MKINELLNEAKMDPEIRNALEAKGYKFLDQGQDQDVYLAPDGTILKIFGTDRGSDIAHYTRGQRSFIDFATYCMKNSNNPFLPQFGGFERFEFNGQYYLQIRCERLFDFKSSKLSRVAELLELLKYEIEEQGIKDGVAEFLNSQVDDAWVEDDPNNAGQLIALLGGQQGLMMLAKTMKDLSKIADAKGYGFDLHSENFMLGSDGHIVINDPFYTGTRR